MRPPSGACPRKEPWGEDHVLPGSTVPEVPAVPELYMPLAPGSAAAAPAAAASFRGRLRSGTPSSLGPSTLDSTSGTCCCCRCLLLVLLLDCCRWLPVSAAGPAAACPGAAGRRWETSRRLASLLSALHRLSLMLGRNSSAANAPVRAPPTWLAWEVECSRAESVTCMMTMKSSATTIAATLSQGSDMLSKLSRMSARYRPMRPYTLPLAPTTRSHGSSHTMLLKLPATPAASQMMKMRMVP
mmetsp:Transcript_29947/g.66281  ORF Transcript_29947/g.66281 Transcript_29947/m.66281 type:complete len:242 (+) Transcript_29947:284-1009(+)